MLTQERAKELFKYSKTTGDLTYRVNRSKCKIGEIASKAINIDGTIYQKTQVIWLIVKGELPTFSIGFKDGDNGNYKWKNLATNSEVKSNRIIKKRMDIKQTPISIFLAVGFA